MASTLLASKHFCIVRILEACCLVYSNCDRGDVTVSAAATFAAAACHRSRLTLWSCGGQISRSTQVGRAPVVLSTDMLRIELP
jgi:hypothetical protein